MQSLIESTFSEQPLKCNCLKNMKQKVVMKVQMKCEKCRTKAKKIAAVTDGVVLVELQGPDKDLVVVVGDGIDSTSLVVSMRKKVGYTTLVTVEEVKPPKPGGGDQKPGGGDKKPGGGGDQKGKDDGKGKVDPVPGNQYLSPYPPYEIGYYQFYDPTPTVGCSIL